MHVRVKQRNLKMLVTSTARKQNSTEGLFVKVHPQHTLLICKIQEDMLYIRNDGHSRGVIWRQCLHCKIPSKRIQQISIHITNLKEPNEAISTKKCDVLMLHRKQLSESWYSDWRREIYPQRQRVKYPIQSFSQYFQIRSRCPFRQSAIKKVGLNGTIYRNKTEVLMKAPWKYQGENTDTRVEHLVGSWLLRVGPVCSIVLFLRFVTSKPKIFNRRDVLPWHLYSH